MWIKGSKYTIFGTHHYVFRWFQIIWDFMYIDNDMKSMNYLRVT